MKAITKTKTAVESTWIFPEQKLDRKNNSIIHYIEPATFDVTMFSSSGSYRYSMWLCPYNIISGSLWSVMVGCYTILRQKRRILFGDNISTFIQRYDKLEAGLTVTRSLNFTTSWYTTKVVKWTHWSIFDMTVQFLLILGRETGGVL